MNELILGCVTLNVNPHARFQINVNLKNVEWRLDCLCEMILSCLFGQNVSGDTAKASIQ